MADIRRYIVGPGRDGRSTALETAPTNIQAQEGFFRQITLWVTRETPADNTIEGDRALTEGLGTRREPFPGGVIIRALEVWPDPEPDVQRAQFAQLNTEVEQKHRSTAADLQRHPSMHRTDTLDSITVVRGQIHLITDTGEVLMTSGDTVIIRGVTHGWSNRSDSPCLMIGTMVDAIPTA